MSGIVHKLSGTLTEIVQTATLSCRIHTSCGQKECYFREELWSCFVYKAYYYNLNLYIYIYKSRPRGANAPQNVERNKKPVLFWPPIIVREKIGQRDFLHKIMKIHSDTFSKWDIHDQCNDFQPFSLIEVSKINQKKIDLPRLEILHSASNFDWILFSTFPTRIFFIKTT